MNLKKFDSFLNENNEMKERYSEVTEYGNSAMEHNNVYLKEIEQGLEAIESDYIDELNFEQDDLDSNSGNLAEDIETLESNKDEIVDLLGQLQELVEDSVEITEKYMSDVVGFDIENVMDKIKTDAWNTGKPDKPGKYVGGDMNYYHHGEDGSWKTDSDNSPHDGPEKWIPTF